VPTSLELTNTK